MNDQQNQNVLVLAQLEAMKLQLVGINNMIQSQHQATNQRIDDLRHSIEGRMDSHESRIEKLEQNERSTAVKAAGVSALTTALMTGFFAALKLWKP